MPLEELDGSFVFLGSDQSLERPEISPLSGPGIFLARIEAVPGLELTYHAHCSFMDGFESTQPAAMVNNFHFSLASNRAYPTLESLRSCHFLPPYAKKPQNQYDI
jgi:hypothetical protein